MLNPRNSTEVLDRDFLESRSRILEVAAILDRIERAPASTDPHTDPRLAKLRQALHCLTDRGSNRAETIQRIFSLEYDPAWRDRMQLTDHPATGH